MKEEKNKLEEKIRDRIYNHSTPAPMDMWSKIEKGITPPGEPTSRVNSKLGWFGIADVLVLLMFIIPFCGKDFSKSKNEVKVFATEVSGQIKSGSMKSKSAKVKAVEENSNPVNDRKIKQESSVPAEIVSDTKITRNSPEPGSGRVRIIASSQTGRKYERKNNAAVIVPLANNLPVAQDRAENENFPLKEKESLTETPPSDEVQNLEEISNTAPKNEQALPENLALKNETHKSDEAPAVQVKAKDSIVEVVSGDSIVPENRITAIETSGNNKGKGKFALEIFASPDFYQIKTKANAASGFADRLDSSGIRQQAWSAGLRLTYLVNKNIQLKSGIYFSSLRLMYAIDKTMTTKELHVDSSSIAYTLQDPFNAPAVFINYDSTYFFNTKSEVLDADIRFRMIDVPVMVQYNWVINKFSVGINAGLSFNILFSKKGQDIQAGTIREIKADDANHSAYKKRLGMSWLAGVNCNYALSNKISVMLEPHYSSLLKSIHTNEYEIKQGWSKLGINAGLGYKF